MLGATLVAQHIHIFTYTFYPIYYIYILHFLWRDVWCGGHAIRGIGNKVHTAEWTGTPHDTVLHVSKIPITSTLPIISFIYRYFIFIYLCIISPLSFFFLHIFITEQWFIMFLSLTEKFVMISRSPPRPYFILYVIIYVYKCIYIYIYIFTIPLHILFFLHISYLRNY